MFNAPTLIRPGASDGLRTMSIPVPAEHAAGATLVVGTVDVISMVGDEPVFVATTSKWSASPTPPRPGCRALAQRRRCGRVSQEQALALARAIADGSLEVLRSTGADVLERGEG